jgi:hypothetical protein
MLAAGRDAGFGVGVLARMSDTAVRCGVTLRGSARAMELKTFVNE